MTSFSPGEVFREGLASFGSVLIAGKAICLLDPYRTQRNNKTDFKSDIFSKKNKKYMYLKQHLDCKVWHGVGTTPVPVSTMSSCGSFSAGMARFSWWGALSTRAAEEDGSVSRLGSCFTNTAVRSWPRDHRPSDSEGAMARQSERRWRRRGRPKVSLCCQQAGIPWQLRGALHLYITFVVTPLVVGLQVSCLGGSNTRPANQRPANPMSANPGPASYFSRPPCQGTPPTLTLSWTRT